MLDFATDRPNLLWLEDRAHTARAEMAYAHNSCALHLVGTPREFVVMLEEVFGQSAEAAALQPFRLGFVIDLMLMGVSDLSAIGVAHADTNGGMHAGYVFVDRFLRTQNSIYRDCPVCFLTERSIDAALKDDVDYLRDRGGGPIVLVMKYDNDEFEKFRAFLDQL